MDMKQEIKTCGNESDVITDVMQEFFNQFQRPVKDENELPKKTVTKLEDLDDVCLREIFSVECLTLIDLCSLAQTCTRFQRIVRQIFPTKLEIVFRPADKKYSVESSKYQRSKTKQLLEKQEAADIENILRSCGSTLSEFSIKDSFYLLESSSFLLNLLSKYFVERLETPFLLPTADNQILKSEQIFSQLQVLVLNRMDIRDGFDSFADFGSLTELRVFDVKGCCSILRTIFPELKRFFFIDSKVNYFSLRSFISHHSRLKTLYSQANIAVTFRSDFLREIGDSCQELEELDLCFLSRGGIYSLLPLQSLKRLEILKLCHVTCTDFSFVPALTNLRELRSYYNDPPKIEQFAYLKQLIKLRVDGDGHFDIVGAVKRLTNLEEFEIRGFTLNKKKFSEIISVVRERPQVLVLKCVFDFPL